jgi:hypothetical protein
MNSISNSLDILMLIRERELYWIIAGNNKYKTLNIAHSMTNMNILCSIYTLFKSQEGNA